MDGTWEVVVPDDLDGKFYTFNVKVRGEWLGETPGIMAKAVGVNGKRGAIIDFHSTNPQGWENDTRPALNNFADIVVYVFVVAACCSASNHRNQAVRAEVVASVVDFYQTSCVECVECWLVSEKVDV